MAQPPRPGDIFYSSLPLREIRSALEAIAGDPRASPEARQEAGGYLASVSQILAHRDATMAAAVQHAAAEVVVDPARGTFLEARLEDALIAGWQTAGGEPSRARVQLTVPGWDPQPGQTDWVATAPSGELVAIAELKVTDVEAALWDLLKVAAILTEETAATGYLVVATSPSKWERAEVSDLFATPPGETATWWTGDLLLRWAASWRWLLSGGRARPVRLPGRLRTTVLADAPTEHIAGHSLRCLKVEPDLGAPHLDLIDGQPQWGEQVTTRDLLTREEEAAGLRDSLEEQRERMRRRHA